MQVEGFSSKYPATSQHDFDNKITSVKNASYLWLRFLKTSYFNRDFVIFMPHNKARGNSHFRPLIIPYKKISGDDCTKLLEYRKNNWPKFVPTNTFIWEPGQLEAIKQLVTFDFPCQAGDIIKHKKTEEKRVVDGFNKHYRRNGSKSSFTLWSTKVTDSNEIDFAANAGSAFMFIENLEVDYEIEYGERDDITLII